MLYKHFSFFLLLTLSTQAFAMDYPDVNHDINKIQMLKEKLQEIEPVQFDVDHGKKLLQEEHLDFTKRPEDVNRLYKKRMCYAGRGGTGIVWEATLAEDRPGANLKKGNVIAIKMVGLISKPFENPKDCLNPKSGLDGIEALIRLSYFKNIKPGETVITEYFPNFYGIYYSEKPLPLNVVGKHPEISTRNPNDTAFFNKVYFRYAEMEYIHSTFKKMYEEPRQAIPDNVLFELMYGEWAGRFFTGITIRDCQSQNIGIKTVPYKRVYHLGKTTYVLPAGEMPVRLDLDDFLTSSLPTEERFNFSSPLFYEPLQRGLVSQRGRNFLENLGDTTYGFFSALMTNFSCFYQMDILDIGLEEEVKHFYIDQKWIDHEENFSRPYQARFSIPGLIERSKRNVAKSNEFRTGLKFEALSSRFNGLADY